MTQALSDAIGGWLFITGVLMFCGMLIYAGFGLPDYKPKSKEPTPDDEAVGDTP